MPLTSAQLFRQQVNDQHRREAELITGDGATSAFQLQGYPIASGTAQSLAGSATVLNPVPTSYSIDFTYGVVTFNGIPSAGSAAGTAVYFHSVFSDEYVDSLLTGFNYDRDRAHLEVIQALMSDAWKRAKWASPGGMQYDESMAQRNLAIAWSAVYNKVFNTPWRDGSVGGLNAWSVEQPYYDNALP